MTETDTQNGSQCLWYNMDTDKYFLIHNATGKMTRVNKNTDYVKEFDPQLTGQVGYQQRVGYAIQKGKPGYMPLQAKSIKPKKNTMFYTPQNDKFESYAQFPNPRTQPYYNQSIEINYDLVKKAEIRAQQKHFKPESNYNQTLFGFGGLRKSNVGVSHLTNTIKDHTEMIEKKQIKQMEERNITQYKKNQSLPSLNITKFINGRGVIPPNESKLRKFKQNLEKNQNAQQLTQSQLIFNIDDEETNPYGLNSQIDSAQNIIISFVHQKEAESTNFKHFSQASQLFKTNTFDGRSFSSPYKDRVLILKSEMEFLKTLKTQKQELEAFILPKEMEKRSLITKGRFKIPPKTTKDLYNEDRQIMMLLNPDLYTEKIDPQKVKQDELRKKINIMKEQEMLDRNLRNKA